MLSVSTRKVEGLVQALGMTGISKSEVSRICGGLDAEVERFRNRPIQGTHPYVWVDAIYLKVREDHVVVSMALVVAVGVKETGEREILGFDLGLSEDGAFWLAFLRGLKARGLSGVRLVVSDAHQGLVSAIQAVFTGAAWQRCRVHFLRNLLAQVPKSAQSMVAAMVRIIFLQPTPAQDKDHLREVARTLEERWPGAAELLIAAENEILAY